MYDNGNEKILTVHHDNDLFSVDDSVDTEHKVNANKKARFFGISHTKKKTVVSHIERSTIWLLMNNFHLLFTSAAFISVSLFIYNSNVLIPL